jgi:hypothetical protein
VRYQVVVDVLGVRPERRRADTRGVDSQNRNHLATVHNSIVDSSADRTSKTVLASVAAALVANPPRRTRSRRPAIVDTAHSKYHDP